MLYGKKIVLRAFEESDLPLYLETARDMRNQLYMNDDIPFPPTFKQAQTFLEKFDASKGEYIFAIEELATRSFIGSVIVFQTNWLNRSTSIGISLHSDWQSQGFGTEIMHTLLQFVFNQMNIRKVKLQVLDFNHRAIRLYEKLGFEVEGTLKQEVFRNNSYHDVMVMALFKENYNFEAPAATQEPVPATTE